MLFRLRVLLFYIAIAIATVVVFVAFCLPLKFSKKYSTKCLIAKICSQIFIWLAKVICGLDYQIEGLEKLPKTPALVLSNHQSFWDNMFMQLIIPRPSWIIKKQLYHIPIFGLVLRMLNPIAIDRSHKSSVKQILIEGEKKFKENLWLVMFPEATRVAPDKTINFKTSAAKLALANNVPIVLIALNAGIYWPKGFWIKKSGTIIVKIITVLLPDEIKDLDVKELTNLIEQTINTEKNHLYENFK